MMNQRGDIPVFVSGIGVVSGIGLNVADNRAALRRGEHGMGKVSLFPTRHEVPVAEVKCSNAVLRKMLGVKGVWSRTALLGMLAAGEALADARMVAGKGWRVGLVSATSVGGMDLSEHFYDTFRKDNAGGRLREVITHDCGDGTERIAAALGIRDYVTTISTACSSAANAVIFGARLIRHGLLDCVVVGGTDALCRFTLNGFSALMILDPEHCRPFDASRSGLNLGEGAGFIVLQSEKSLARAPYAVLAGYANANDAFHQTASSPDGYGPWLAMKGALQMSGLRPDEVDYVNVHGTGTPNNDASEGAALRRLFGDTVCRFSSTKAFTGHTLGAAGGIEAVFSVLALAEGMVYPNLNFVTPVEGLGLYPETKFQNNLLLRAVLSNSFGFGGNNSSLIFTAL